MTPTMKAMTTPAQKPMSRGARTVFVFGLYLVVLGIGLLAMPAPLLAPFGLPAPLDVWARVAGMVVAILGVHYVLAAGHGLQAFFAWTVATRASVIVVFAVLVTAGVGPAVLWVFGAVDLAGALWTWKALERDAA